MVVINFRKTNNFLTSRSKFSVFFLSLKSEITKSLHHKQLAAEQEVIDCRTCRDADTVWTAQNKTLRFEMFSCLHTHTAHLNYFKKHSLCAACAKVGCQNDVCLWSTALLRELRKIFEETSDTLQTRSARSEMRSEKSSRNRFYSVRRIRLNAPCFSFS
jgi:hypothetical protein